MFDQIPEPSTLFQFIQEQGKFSDKRMYVTFNMGAGFALYVEEYYIEEVITIAAEHEIRAWKAGFVEKEKNKRRVVIRPKNIEFLPTAEYTPG